MPSGIYVRAEEEKKKHSEAMEKVWKQPGYREMMSEIQKKYLAKNPDKHPSKNPEVRKKKSEAYVRRFQDPEERRKISEARLGMNPEFPNGHPGHRHSKSRDVWEEYHGRKIPKGMLIHHLDWNWENIDPINLALLTFSHHRTIHYKKLKAKSIRDLANILHKKEEQ